MIGKLLVKLGSGAMPIALIVAVISLALYVYYHKP